MAPLPAPHSFMAVLSRLGKLLQGARGLEDKLTATYSLLQESLGYELVWLGLLQDKGRSIQGKGGLAPTHPTALFHHRRLEPGTLEDIITGHKKVLQIPDIQQDLRCREWWKFAKEWDIHGAVAFPVLQRGEAVGLGLLGQRRWGLMLSAEEEESLILLGGLLGGALASDESVIRRQEELTSPLLAMADRLRQVYDAETILQAVVDELYERLQPTRAVIYWSVSPQEFEVRAFTQNSSRYYVLPLGMRLAVRDISGLHQQLSQDCTVSITDAQQDLRGYLAKSALQRLQIQALLAHPIIFQKQLLGYLSLEQCDEPRLWSEQEQRLVQGMANLIGVTASQARLYEMERRRFLEQMLINRIVQDIRNSLDVREVMAAAVDRLGQGLNLDRCILLSYEPEAQALRVLHQFCKSGVPALAPQLPWPEVESDQLMLTSSIPVPIEDISRDFRFFSWREVLALGSTRSLMLCGLAYQGKPNGILCLHRCFLPQPWTAEEREIFQAVSDQVGIALGQAKLFQQVREQGELETKLNRSTRILRQANSAPQVLQLILQEIQENLAAPAVLLIGPEGENWVLLNQVQSNYLTKTVDLAPHYPLLEHLSYQKEVLTLNGPLKGLGNKNYSILAGRLIMQQTCLGLVLVLDDEKRVWNHVEQQLLTRLSQEALLVYGQISAFAKLQQLSQQLKELNTYRNNMLSIASHEMRTPLTSISLFIETLLIDRELISDEELEQMMQECNRMTNLVSNISTLVNLEANTTKFTYQLVQIPDVLTRLEKRLIPLAQRNHIQLSFEDQTHNLHFETDPQKLEAILFNLLENACLHTLSNVRVQLKVEAFPETVHFTVLDNGQGIPQDKLPTLFQPFIRVEEVMNHSKGGAGLGLAITRELVEKMGGTIVVESTQGQGSQFTVSLPQYP